MRDFLFKGKCIHSGKLVYGYYVYYPNGICDDGSPEHAIIDTEKSFIYSVYPETVCQYTGLTDKNGRKIFEGDIVRHFNWSDDNEKYVIGCIKWNQDFCKFVKEDEEGVQYVINNKSIYEVIGNIFDNS